VGAKPVQAGVIAVLMSVPALAHGAVREPRGATTAALYNLAAFPRPSFVWFPPLPRTNERFSLVSTSTDPTSPIVGYAWDVSDNGPFGAFQPSGPATNATFSTPADHVVRLRVTAADHLSSIAAEVIRMSTPPPGVLLPFPLVRIAGALVRGGVKLRTLSILAPSQARMEVSCRGRGCPVRSVIRVATSRSGREVRTRLRPFERFLPAGVTLETRVSRDGDIGAYTRFTVRHHRLPVRVDSCLDPAGVKPVACPS
jgi:hypothetical protein